MPLCLLHLAAASVLLAATAETLSTQDHQAVNWPPLRFTISNKHSSCLSKFSVLATPTLSDNSTQVFYYVSGRFTNVNDNPKVHDAEKCFNLKSRKVPSINSVVSAINEASALPRDSGSDECTTGNLFKVSLNGVTLMLCSSTKGFTMTSRELDISVEYLTKPADVKPTGDSFATTLTAIGQTLLTARIRKKRRYGGLRQLCWGISRIQVRY